jgi:hypothetical protein
MKTKLKKKPAPEKKPSVIVCSGSELALVLGKIRRMGCSASEPMKVGINYEITVGAPADDFDRRTREDESIWTFGHPNVTLP